jgi:hypothetical protein
MCYAEREGVSIRYSLIDDRLIEAHGLPGEVLAPRKVGGTHKAAGQA